MFRQLTAGLAALSLVIAGCGVKAPTATTATPNTDLSADVSSAFNADSCAAGSDTYNAATGLCTTAGPATTTTNIDDNDSNNTHPCLWNSFDSKCPWNWVMVAVTGAVVYQYIKSACFDKDGTKKGSTTPTSPCDWTPWTDADGGTKALSNGSGTKQLIGNVEVTIPYGSTAEVKTATAFTGSQTSFVLQGWAKLDDMIVVGQKSYGDEALFCINASNLTVPSTAISGSDGTAGQAQIQMSGNFNQFLQYETAADKKAGTTIPRDGNNSLTGKTKEQLFSYCTAHVNSAIVGIQTTSANASFVAYKINPLALGWGTTSTTGVKAASSLMVFSNLGSISTAQTIFQSLTDSGNQTNPLAVRSDLNTFPTQTFKTCDLQTDATQKLNCKITALLSKPWGTTVTNPGPSGFIFPVPK